MKDTNLISLRTREVPPASAEPLLAAKGHNNLNIYFSLYLVFNGGNHENYATLSRCDIN
jgi:hypothetical protein